MKKWTVLLFLLLGLAGCGYTATGNVNQVQLAIYTPICVDVLDASTAPGQKLQIYPLCMSVYSPYDTAPGQYLIQEPCVADHSDLDQVWNIVKVSSGEAGVQIISAMSKQCLDLSYGETASITTPQWYYCHTNDPAQGWNINPVAKRNIP